MNGFVYQTKIGELTFIEENGILIEIGFGSALGSVLEKETSFLKEAKQQVEEYLEGNRKQFTIPFKVQGTSFQKSVYEALLQIPYGEVRSYSDIARAIQNPKAVRAVGNANNHNRLPILIPCHRVVGKNGKMVGYAGGLSIKETLLTIEGYTKKD
ncbi:MAG: methylated-DNA--[protein]-cysteine S-methyltransferase [Bacilli bacterium]|nr:methylated-DNA--[protein]-cysteine S-methyltransferase [Bacilli bacterium]